MSCKRAAGDLLSRLRALSGARRSPGPARPEGEAGGRVDRRRLLGLLGAAPVAVPALVKSAAGPRFATLALDVQRSGSVAGSSMIFDARGRLVELYPGNRFWHRNLSGATYGDFDPLRADPARVAAAFREEHARWPALGLDRLPAADTAPFIDDVGSGP